MRGFMGLLRGCQELLETTRTELYQARRELAAVDEALGEFYCLVRDPETDEKQGSFYLDHGVHIMGMELERLQKENDQLRRQSCNHSAHNWNLRKDGAWVCRGCGEVMKEAREDERA